ncbi:MAG: oxidoreductase, partial [Cellulosimicrobium sp.]|nr:oxidoreductase [Cellulosimicrobium sp.]
VREHLDALDALAATSDAADVPPSYRALGRAATHRALAGGRLDEQTARTLLDALGEAHEAGPGAAPHDEPHDPHDPHDDEGTA